MTFVPMASATEATVQEVVPVAGPDPPRLFAHDTLDTPTLSPAVPPSAIVAEEVSQLAALVGVVIWIVGAWVSAARVIVIVSTAVLPTPSVAVTVTTLSPGESTTAAMLQAVVPVAVPDPPRLFAQVTDATTRSSEAVPLTAMDDALVE
jgi:hypothetical protein